MRSSPTLEHLQHPNWKHPVLNCTIGPLLASLTSLPSASLSDRATRLFQSLQLFLTTKLTLRDLNYHIHSAQHIIGTCLKHSPLQDELYCQVLRQISGHTSTVSIQVTQVCVRYSVCRGGSRILKGGGGSQHPRGQRLRV